MVACSVRLVSKVMNVNNVLIRGCREKVATNVYLVSREIVAIHVLMVSMGNPVVSDKQYLFKSRHKISGHYYRPQTKLRKGNVLHLSVILSTGEGVQPPWADTSWADTPFGQTPPPPRDSHGSRWYASFCNAFLFFSVNALKLILSFSQ